MAQTSASAVTAILNIRRMSSLDISSTIRTGNDRQLTSKFLKTIHAEIRITLLTTKVYHPQTRVLEKKYDTTIVFQLRQYVDEHQQWLTKFRSPRPTSPTGNIFYNNTYGRKKCSQATTPFGKPTTKADYNTDGVLTRVSPIDKASQT